jgi:hypothetical protein
MRQVQGDKLGHERHGAGERQDVQLLVGGGTVRVRDEDVGEEGHAALVELGFDGD